VGGCIAEGHLKTGYQCCGMFQIIQKLNGTLKFTIFEKKKAELHEFTQFQTNHLTEIFKITRNSNWSLDL